MTTNVAARRVSLGGITFNTTDDDGVLWGLDHLDGWGSPASTAAYVQKPRGHGAWRAGPAYLTPRSIAAGGLVQAPSEALAAAAEDRLLDAVPLDPQRMDVIEPGRDPRWANVARDGEVLTEWVTDRAFVWSAQLKAPDPRKYGEPITLSTGLPSSSGGLTWPVTWPITWTGVTTTGVLHIDNPGNIPSPIMARIDGPVTGPSLRHVSSGVELVLSSTYVVGAGSWLEVDMERRTVLEGGTASRNGWVVDRGFFLLDPGANDVIFGAQSYDPGALLTVTTWPAYK